jgi:hypothetical protein
MGCGDAFQPRMRWIGGAAPGGSSVSRAMVSAETAPSSRQQAA